MHISDFFCTFAGDFAFFRYKKRSDNIMTIRYTTLGCKLNFAETSSLGKALSERGHVRAKAGEQADVCIINTCSVTDTADQKDRQAIHRLRRENPNAILIVTGCYAQLASERKVKAEALPASTIAFPWQEVDYVLGQNEKYSIPALLDDIGAQTKPVAATGAEDAQSAEIHTSVMREVEEYHSAYSKDDRTRCFLKVQDGCNYFCTYCTIPMARGKSRNGSIASIVREAQQAIADGAKEIVLTGVNIGDFGRSTGETFMDLLRALDNLSGINYRIRISSCEPNLLSDEVIDFVAGSQHFAPHFHIPLQSGSDTVLKIMHRHYDTALFRERIEHIKTVMPHAFIGVDCMVGVRGETDECFEEYVRFVESLDVSQLHVFTYSERADTRMLEMDLCVVPMRERQRRSKVLHEISARKTAAFYAAHRGQEFTALWEAKRETGEQGESLMSGFTENYIRVFAPYDKAKVNTFERVTI